MQWASFEVNFPANEDTVIRVSYLLFGGGDSVTNVGYTLETGAAWKGPIGEAIIVFRFPYVVDDFIMPGTTPGYRVMQNEIYWRYENFEPDHSDNIDVAFINPKTWAIIRDSRARIRNNPKDDTAWVALADSYYGISHWHGSNVRSKEYAQRVYKTFRDGLKENPNSAVLNAGYAELLQWECCTYGFEPLVDSQWADIRRHLLKALEQDPSNERALRVLEMLQNNYPNVVDITSGPTFTPTVTLTPTPRSTPTVSSTPKNTRTPYATWTRTITPTRRARTPQTTKTATMVSSYTPPSMTVTPVVQGEQITAPEGNRTDWWERAGLIAAGFGLGIAVMWMRRRKA